MTGRATGVSISAIRLTCADPGATAQFYVTAFGARRVGAGLALGTQHLEFARAVGAASLPAVSNSTAFQHCAIVVDDMSAAMARLCACTGWTPISTDGPETLPPASGGVTAFKFRDPEGHPLEFLKFPAKAAPRYVSGDADGPCLGIDHSAITVSETGRAIAFYAALGFKASKGQINSGPAQSRLDGVAGARVEVTALELRGGGAPHLELLCYRHPRRPSRNGPAGRRPRHLPRALGRIRPRRGARPRRPCPRDPGPRPAVNALRRPRDRPYVFHMHSIRVPDRARPR